MKISTIYYTYLGKLVLSVFKFLFFFGNFVKLRFFKLSLVNTHMCAVDIYSGILRDKTMEDILIYIHPNDDKQDYNFCVIK